MHFGAKFRPNVVRAKAFVESVLSPHFDLSIKLVGRDAPLPNLRAVIECIWKPFGVWITLFLDGIVGIFFLNQPWRMWLGMSWLAIFGVGWCAIMIAQSRKQERLYPTWRLRRKEECLC
jgi:hypothetical protein